MYVAGVLSFVYIHKYIVYSQYGNYEDSNEAH